MLLPVENLKVCSRPPFDWGVSSVLCDAALQECVDFATQSLLAAMPNARVAKAQENFYSHVFVSGRQVPLVQLLACHARNRPLPLPCR